MYEEGPDFEGSDWFNVKYSLGFDFPNLPYFIDGDLKFTESAAIIRYICSKHDSSLLGSAPEQLAHVEMAAGIVGDLK